MPAMVRKSTDGLRRLWVVARPSEMGEKRTVRDNRSFRSESRRERVLGAIGRQDFLANGKLVHEQAKAL